MKSNDSIPADEMLLAEAHAAAKARNLGWTRYTRFRDSAGNWCNPAEAASCCVLGALEFAGRLSRGGITYELRNASEGNDCDERIWGPCTDGSESLGWAFRCAMTQDESDPDTERLIRERSAL
jgi:hypothetical protein